MFVINILIKIQLFLIFDNIIINIMYLLRKNTEIRKIHHIKQSRGCLNVVARKR